jgi:hypothetical protein
LPPNHTSTKATNWHTQRGRASKITPLKPKASSK